MIYPRGRKVALLMVKYVGNNMLGLLAWDVLVVVAFNAGYLHWAALESVPLSLLGSAIGVILAFRNSSSYARWWEARTLWGSIVNNSRSWARLVTVTMRGQREDEAALALAIKKMVYLQIAWCHALRQHLRRLDVIPAISSFFSPEEIDQLKVTGHFPVAIQQMQTKMLRDALDNGWIDAAQWHAMNQSLDDLVDAQGGTERIKNTPMPRQYDYLPQLSAQIFCFLLPLTMVASMGWFTPLGSSIVGFIFLMLDKIGRDLEDPFDNTIHDIPLTALTRTIEINLRQMLGETELPPPIAPVDDVLW